MMGARRWRSPGGTARQKERARGVPAMYHAVSAVVRPPNMSVDETCLDEMDTVFEMPVVKVAWRLLSWVAVECRRRPLSA